MLRQFVVPVLLYALTREQKPSLVFKHARAACLMWIAVLIIWLPGLFTVITNLSAPPTWAAILGGVLGAAVVRSGFEGSVLALLGVPCTSLRTTWRVPLPRSGARVVSAL